MDAHGPDFSVLSVYRRGIHGVVICDAAGAWRLAARTDEACGAAEVADLANRLCHSYLALCRLFPHALPRSIAADRPCVSVLVGDYALDGRPRAHHLDCRTARR